MCARASFAIRKENLIGTGQTALHAIATQWSPCNRQRAVPPHSDAYPNHPLTRKLEIVGARMRIYCYRAHTHANSQSRFQSFGRNATRCCLLSTVSRNLSWQIYRDVAVMHACQMDQPLWSAMVDQIVKLGWWNAECSSPE